jgi:hypothetical protein
VLVICGGRFGVVGPFAVDDVLVFVGAGEECECDAEVDLSVLVALPGQLLHCLPFRPASSDQHLGRVLLSLGLPDEAGLLGGAGAVVVVAALLTRGGHL